MREQERIVVGSDPAPSRSWLSLLQLGSTAIGIATKEGVVLVVEKRITSVLLVR